MILNIMTKVIVDTSVVIKWFFSENEADLGQSDNFLKQVKAGEVEIIVPKIILLELANVAKFGKKVDEDVCRQVLSTFNDLVTEYLDLPGSEELIKNFYLGDLTSYDAVFVTLADLKEMPLLTADYKHHKKSISPNIVWLSEWKS